MGLLHVLSVCFAASLFALSLSVPLQIPSNYDESLKGSLLHPSDGQNSTFASGSSEDCDNDNDTYVVSGVVLEVGVLESESEEDTNSSEAVNPPGLLTESEVEFFFPNVTVNGTTGEAVDLPTDLLHGLPANNTTEN